VKRKLTILVLTVFVLGLIVGQVSLANARTITANTYVAHFGQTVTSFEIEGISDVGANIKAEDFLILGDRIDAVQLTEGTDDVKEVIYNDGTLTLNVGEFRYFASDFVVVYLGPEDINLSFSKEQVDFVKTAIADDFQAFETDVLKYRLYIPENANGPLPLVVWTHGGGERGTDNWAQVVANRGATAWVEHFGDVIVLAPQVSGQWSEIELAEVRSIILGLIEDGIVDSNRIYGSGCSFGGKGIILNAAYSPDLFTAIAPICPTNDSITLEAFEELVDMPIWITTAFEDTRPTRHIDWTLSIDKLTDAGNKNAKITLYQQYEFNRYNLGFATNTSELATEFHHAWVLTMNNEYGIMDWLWSWSK